jgi:hypothetical protein
LRPEHIARQDSIETYFQLLRHRFPSLGKAPIVRRVKKRSKPLLGRG